jgi:hypothetical protein
MKDAESNKLIVIVEDDPDVARIIEQVLGDFFPYRLVPQRQRLAAPPARLSSRLVHHRPRPARHGWH